MATPDLTLENLIQKASPDELRFLQENAQSPELREALGMEGKGASFGDVILRGQESSGEIDKLLNTQSVPFVPVNKELSNGVLQDTKEQMEIDKEDILNGISVAAIDPVVAPSVASRLGIIGMLGQAQVNDTTDADLEKEAFRIQQSSDALGELQDIFGQSIVADLSLGLEQLAELGLTSEDTESLTSEELLDIVSDFPDLIKKDKISAIDAVNVSFKIFNSLMNITDDPIMQLQLERAAAVTAIQLMDVADTRTNQILSVAGLFGPFFFTKDVSDFAHGEFSKVQGILLDMLPLDRLKVLPGIWLAMVEATDNNLIQAARLFGILLGDDNIRSEVGLDILLGLVDVTIAGDLIRIVRASKAASTVDEVAAVIALAETPVKTIDSILVKEFTAPAPIKIIKGEPLRNFKLEKALANIQLKIRRLRRKIDPDRDETLTVVEARAKRAELIIPDKKGGPPTKTKKGKALDAELKRLEAKEKVIEDKLEDVTLASVETIKPVSVEIIKLQREGLEDLAADMIQSSKKSPVMRKALGMSQSDELMSSIPITRDSVLNAVNPTIATKTIIRSLEEEANSISVAVTAGGSGRGSTKTILRNLRNGVGELDGVAMRSFITQHKDEVGELVTRLMKFSVNDIAIDLNKKRLYKLVGDDESFVKLLEERALFTQPILSKIAIQIGTKTTATKLKAGLKGVEPKVVEETGSTLFVETRLNEKAFSGISEADRTLKWRIPIDLKTGDINLGSITLAKNKIARIFQSPDAWLIQLEKGSVVVSAATTAGRRAARLHQGFFKAFRISIKGITGKMEQKQLLHVLQQGAKESQIFSIGYLINRRFSMVVGGIGDTAKVVQFQLSDNQISAYLKLRTLMDRNWDLANAVARREREIGGQKFFNSNVFRNAGRRKALKTILHEEDAQGIFVRATTARGLQKSGATKVIDASTGRVVTLDKEITKTVNDGKIQVFKTVKEHGIRLFETTRAIPKTATGHVLPNKGEKFERFEYFIVRKSNTGANGVTSVINPLPQKVLNYVPGYIPIVRKGVQFVIEKAEKAAVNGGDLRSIPVTKGFAGTELSAEELKATIAAKEGSSIKKYKVVPSQESRFASGDTGLTGGALDSHRSGYHFFTDDLVAEVDPITAISAALGRSSRDLATVEFKAQIREGFLQSAGKYLRSSTDFDSPVAVGKKVAGVKINKSLAGRIEDTRDSIRGFLSLPTKSESVWVPSVARSFARLLDPKGEKALFKLTRQKSSQLLWENQFGDPLGAVRAANYWLFFAANPAIGFVQTFAILMPFAFSPLRATGALMQYPIFRMAMLDKIRYGSLSNSPNFQRFLDMAGQLTGAGFKGILSKEDFRKTLEIFDESGFMDSVFNISDLPMGNKFAQGWFTRAAQTVGAFPFKEGELMARTTAFNTAAREFSSKATKLNPRGLGKPLHKFTPGEVELVLKRATDLSFRFDRANRALWQQESISATITQFFQVGSKFVEDLVGSTAVLTKVPGKFFKVTDLSRSKFTRLERGQLALASLLAFGAAGLPLVPKDTVMQAFKDMGADVDDPEVSAAIGQGLVGYMTALVFGEDVADISGRGSPLKQWDMFLETFSKMAPFISNSRHWDVQTAGGRSGMGAWVNNYLRLGDSFIKIVDLIGIVNEPGFWDYTKRDDIKQMISLFAETIAEVPTGSRNVVDAWKYYQWGKITDRAGNPLITAEDEQFYVSIMSKAIGWNLTDIADFSRVKRLDQLVTGSVGASGPSELDRALLRRFIQKSARGEISNNLYQISKDHLLAGLTPAEQERIVLNEFKKVWQTDTVIQKMFEDVERNLNATLPSQSESDIAAIRRRMELLLKGILDQEGN